MRGSLFVPYARHAPAAADGVARERLRILTPATAGNPVEKITWEDYFKSSQQKIDLREWERPLPASS